MDVEIGIRNDWKYFNTPPQSQPSILSLTVGSIGYKAVPRMPAVARGFGRVCMATLGHARLLLSCTRSRWFAPGRARLHRVCTYSRQSVPVRTRSAPGHSRSRWVYTKSRQSMPIRSGLTISLMS